MSEFSEHNAGLPENNLEKEFGITVERITGMDLDKETLSQIVYVERKSFPKKMCSPVDELKEILEDDGIHLVAKNAKGNIIGYLSSLRQSEEYEDLKKYDPDFVNNPEGLYIESIAVAPKRRKEKIATHFLRVLQAEARSLGFRKLTMHARQSSGFSSLVQKEFVVKPLRHFTNWHDFDEPFDYLEIDLQESER